MFSMIPVWQAALAVLIAGGVGTLVGMIVVSAMIAAGRADVRMGEQ
jgi:hypothetical protein